MAKVAKEREPKSVISQNAILVETINKEKRFEKLYTNYSINPFRKMHVITGKPNSFYDNEEGEEDVQFINSIKRANEEPVRKYVYPQTTSQDYGWISSPLIDFDREDRRLNFTRQGSQITKYAEAALALSGGSEAKAQKNAAKK